MLTYCLLLVISGSVKYKLTRKALDLGIDFIDILGSSGQFVILLEMFCKMFFLLENCVSITMDFKFLK